VRIAVRHEEPLRFLDGGQLVHADGRIQCGGESGEDSFAVGGDAVPVVNHQQLVPVPAQVGGEPVAVTDHGFGRAGSQPVTGPAPGIIDPGGTGHFVEVDVRVLGMRPQPGPGVIPVRPRRWRVKSGHLGWPRGEGDQPRECPGEGPGRAARAGEQGAAGDVGLSGRHAVTEWGGAGERLGTRIAGCEQAALDFHACRHPRRIGTYLDHDGPAIRQPEPDDR
jgi:hypothetical protein